MYEEVWGEFSERLGRRLGNGAYTTEESVKYLLSETIVSELCGGNSDRCLLEVPFREDSLGVEVGNLAGIGARRSRLDALFETEGGVALAVEVKYDRRGENTMFGSNLALRLQGNVVNDVFRLANVARYGKNTNVSRCLVYVAEREVAGCLMSPGNGGDFRRMLNRIYCAAVGEAFELRVVREGDGKRLLCDGKDVGVRNRKIMELATKSVVPERRARIRCLHAGDLCLGNIVRVFGVEGLGG